MQNRTKTKALRLIAAAAALPAAFGAAADAGAPPTITNVTTMTSYATIQDALNAAVSGDVIEIGAGTVSEDDIAFPNGVDLTLRGAGMDVTFIDGGAGMTDDPILRILNSGQTAATLIEDLTLINGVNTTFNGALRIHNTDPTFRRVAVRDCQGPSSSAGTASVEANASDSLFDRCEFTGASSAFDAFTTYGCSLTFLQCLFADNATTTALNSQNASSNLLVNCTVNASDRALTVINGGPSTVNAVNSIVLGQLRQFSGGSILLSRCVRPGAGGSNINGSPTFVNAGAGDYRLAAGSLGIDAADADAFMAAGGGLLDLAGTARVNNDPGVADTGLGPFSCLDVGPYEYQDATPGACAADLNGDGQINASDLALILGSWGVCP